MMIHLIVAARGRKVSHEAQDCNREGKNLSVVSGPWSVVCAAQTDCLKIKCSAYRSETTDN
jgi:hypothetical protein